MTYLTFLVKMHLINKIFKIILIFKIFFIYLHKLLIFFQKLIYLYIEIEQQSLKKIERAKGSDSPHQFYKVSDVTLDSTQ